MADLQNPFQPDAEAFGSGSVLLNVLCFLDVKEIQQSLVTEDGLRIIKLPGFPKTLEEFIRAKSVLTEAGLVTLTQNTPIVAYKIGEDVKTAVMELLTEEERLDAFNTAAIFVSAAWPFLDTFNITKTARLMFVREHMAHVIALRENCLALERDGFMPDAEICALLHEEAWFQMMQTTIDDMHISCFYNGLPLASRMLSHHQQNATENPRDVDYDHLNMNQSRAESISASMIGKKGTAVSKRLSWIGQLYAEIERRGRMDDRRTIPMKDYEIGMTELYCENVQDCAGIEKSQVAIRTIDSLKSEQKYDWAMPQITFALMKVHCKSNHEAAREILLPLLQQHTERDGRIFDDTSELQTGIVLYAMGTVTYFSTPDPSTASLREALGFLRQAIDVLTVTHGKQALWTLAASYRMAVCYYDLREYTSAVGLLEKVCFAFQGYRFQHGPNHEGGVDILWQKVRAMWKLAAALMGVGTDEAERDAEPIITEAQRLYYEIGRSEPGMEDKDWDRQILPFYR
ncbi:hypothetical protein DHEL01_v203645 [Diaporthe helianthi]|uniref:Uncharacterized protein n=1 Tax=Diaporthe helianthi TaxID=158607 RepID=A0A2P5I612_DIAHE|nr:hypothetical protein DHEL01_v203645 [Diaporthe helianthi]